MGGESVSNPQLAEVLGLKNDFKGRGVPTLDVKIGQEKMNFRGFGKFEIKRKNGEKLGLVELSR